jgi:YegS C-terminal NAD kinase beta sandwich-like domain
VSVRRGEPWGRPTDAEPDRVIEGDDASLAACVENAPGALVRFRSSSDSDLARAVGGSSSGTPVGTELPMDALVLADGSLAVNMVVLGTPPDRLTRFSRRVALTVDLDGNRWFDGTATTVLVAVGQWLRGCDVVPRGHPGDGRVETQVYRLRARERREMRRRLPTGGHLPHPRILARTARTLEIEAATPLALEVDGVGRPAVSRLLAEVRSDAYRLLV